MERGAEQLVLLGCTVRYGVCGPSEHFLGALHMQIFLHSYEKQNNTIVAFINDYQSVSFPI